MNDKEFRLTLPKGDSTEELTLTTSLIFVGANGSGKSRLGAWIENNGSHKEKVHRISAQKSLAMPEKITPVAMEVATNSLLYGDPKGTPKDRESRRWYRKPAVTQLNDFDHLMSYLFSDLSKIACAYHAESKATPTERVKPPTTKLEQVKNVWEKILPHRQLEIGELEIRTKVTETPDTEYACFEMSDGERVIFYLLGQCLAAPKGGIIIIDEPELHLHKSIQASLWSEAEKLRPDCLFIYLTHDVDFAVAKESAKLVWLKSFDGKDWEWEEIKEDQNLPGELLIEVLGSRKPVVFVEGTNGSHDVSFYRELLSDFLVVPRGSCVQVIQTVKALRANSQVHHLEVFGLIDRDRRVETEIQALKNDFIYVLSVAEVENLFCTKEVLEIVSKHLGRDASSDFEKITKFAFNRLEQELENQVSLRTASEVKFRLNGFDERAKGSSQLKDSLQSLTSEIDVESIYSEYEEKFQQVLKDEDYEGLLQLYNRKTLSLQVSPFLGLDNSLPELIVGLTKDRCRDSIIHATQKYLGGFEECCPDRSTSS